MKGTAISTFLLITLATLSNCSTAHRLESGSYVLSIQQTTSSTSMAKTVNIVVEGQQVKIQNPEHKLVFTGKLEGNVFMVMGKNDNQTVEFQGKMVADNQVAGKVIQKSDSSVKRQAKFTIKKPDPKK